MDEHLTHAPGSPARRHRRFVTPWLLTCPQRLPLLEATLASFRQTDWQSPLRIHCTPTAGERGEPDEDPIQRAHLAVLRSALDGPGTHFLIMEDDVTFNLHLHHNLIHWELWNHVEEIHFATLYNPGLKSAVLVYPTAFTFLPETAVGAQARLFSRACAQHILDNLTPSPLRQEPRVAELAATLGPLWVHKPSLVQHAGRESTWGGPWHEAVDFHPDWRATEEG